MNHESRNLNLEAKAKNRKLFQASSYKLRLQSGFTLMEIVVATTIFATTLVLMFALFTYTLRINRRADSLRQATQGMRNFTEFLVKEIRNGQIDYAAGGTSPIGACYNDTYPNDGINLGLISIDGERECIHYDSATKTITIQKEGTAAYSLNPQFFSVEDVHFIVRPNNDPYTGTPSYPQIQPFVTMAITFRTQPYGSDSVVTIPYQTTVSSDMYDIPQ